jgi:hypothetical protein
MSQFSIVYEAYIYDLKYIYPMNLIYKYCTDFLIEVNQSQFSIVYDAYIYHMKYI